VKIPSVFQTVFVLSLATAQTFAQAPDPARTVKGWARVDKDGSVACYDPASRKILVWMRDGGVVGSVDLSALPNPPEKWVLDASLNAWVVSGTRLQFVGRDGSVFTTKLPYPVGDLAWDTGGIYLSYQCTEPFIEKRGFDAGSVIWYFKSRTAQEAASSTVQQRIVVTEDRTVVVSRKDSLQVDLIDGQNGRLKAPMDFTVKGRPVPALSMGSQDRGAMAWWLDRDIAFQALPASQAPSLGLAGLLLVRQDFAKGSMEFLSTGLSEQYQFIGIVDSDAAFIAPAGGLVFVPVG
jgi:hypothetical protein